MEKLFDNLWLFLVFFVPGFVSLKVYDLLVPSERRDFSKSLYDAVAYSALNFAALLWLIVRMRPNWIAGDLTAAWYWSAFVLFVAGPAVWPVLLLSIRRLPPLTGYIADPNPRVWDRLFRKKQPFWVIVHLKDQRRIGGLYSTRSFASNSPATPEIYIEQVWKLDDNGVFLEPVESSAGVLILGEQILAIELFWYDQNIGNGEPSHTA